MRRAEIFASLLCAVAATCACSPGVAADLTAGKALYEVCAGCHGFQAEGNWEASAPRLTTLEPWYLTRQLRDFASGVRGADAKDMHGSSMAPFALTVADDRSLEDVVAYIESLSSDPPAQTVTGDAERGRGLYAGCAACHGMQAEGNEQLSAPRLAGLDDWYIVNEMALYRAGLRGADPSDTYGQQMRPMAGLLADDQAVKDVAAYLVMLGQN